MYQVNNADDYNVIRFENAIRDSYNKNQRNNKNIHEAIWPRNIYKYDDMTDRIKINNSKWITRQELENGELDWEDPHDVEVGFNPPKAKENNNPKRRIIIKEAN